MKTKTTYTIAFNISKNKSIQDWKTYYELLSEEEAMTVAVKMSNMKEKRFNKLVNHTSKKFLHMRTTKVWVTKVIHNEEVETVSFEKQLNEAIDDLLKREDEYLQRQSKNDI